MSAHLTVYEMAIVAERPLRMRQLDNASRIAQAEAASGTPANALRRRIGGALQRFRWSGVAGPQGTETRLGRLTTVGQPAN